jgi:hypothetical protein
MSMGKKVDELVNKEVYGYGVLYKFLRELHKKEKHFQLEMLENNEISADEFGTDEEIFDHMIDWFVEDIRNLRLSDIK